MDAAGSIEERRCKVCNRLLGPPRIRRGRTKPAEHCSHNCYLKGLPPSGLEQPIFDALAAAGIEIEPQAHRGRYSFDAAVLNTSILIEIDGTYWHQSPRAKYRDRKKGDWAERKGFTLYRISQAVWKADPEGALAPILAHYADLKGD